MKFLKPLLIFLLIWSTAIAQNNKLSVFFENAPIDEILHAIEKQSNFKFFYQNEQVDLKRRISLNLKDAGIKDILDIIFNKTEIKYLVLDNNLIVITPLNISIPFNISGKVVDKRTGASITGVNVIVESTKEGSITDENGKFQLEVPNDTSVLLFSFIGYISQTVFVGTEKEINVALEEEIKGLDEIIVVGYGIQKKKEVTSSIMSLKEDAFNKGAISSPMQLLQGKVAGLSVTRNNGSDPNSVPQFQLRGISTVNAEADPLIIIDGIAGGNISTISPEDIESIDILRDGSAAAIYGTRGTNGVVIITTKKWKVGAPVISYNGYATFQTVAKRIEVLSASDYRKYIRDNNLNPYIYDKGYNTDWFKELIRMPVSHVHNISVSGGYEKTSYMASITYRDLEGIVFNSKKSNLNTRLSISRKALNDKLILQGDLYNVISKSNYINFDIYRYAMTMNPTAPVKAADGLFYQEEGFENQNPVAMLKQTDDEGTFHGLIGNVKTSLEILKDFKCNVTLGLQKIDSLYGFYESRNSYNSVKNAYNGLARRESKSGFDRTIEFTTDYSKYFDNHSISAMAGYCYQDFIGEGFRAENRDFLTDAFKYNNLNSGEYLKQGLADMSSYKWTSKLIAFFGRAIYNYKDKYLITSSLRYEGSSKFGKNHKWGLFPSASVGWRIKEEGFLKDINEINELKVRLGYGITGNAATENYISLSKLSGQGKFLYNGKYREGYGPSSNPNPDLKWERKTETNLGIDFAFFNSRLNGSLDFYNRTTIDLLFQYYVPVPPNLYESIITNVGKIQNMGFEFLLNAIPIQTKKILWNLSFNISYNSNRLLSISNDRYKRDYIDMVWLGAPGIQTNCYRIEEGKPLGNMYGFVFEGFSPNGEWIFKDNDGNGKITEEDKFILGNGLPKLLTGITNSVQYANFDFTIMSRGVFIFDILNVKRAFFENQMNFPMNFLKKGKDIPLKEEPRFSSYYVEKGDYIKLDNVTLGYTINVHKNKYLKKVRIYVSGLNLYCFTNYSGVDPEVDSGGINPGLDDRAAYPRTRSFTMGLSLDF